MNESQRRAFAALGLGPRWRVRTPQGASLDGAETAEVADAGEAPPLSASQQASRSHPPPPQLHAEMQPYHEPQSRARTGAPISAASASSDVGRIGIGAADMDATDPAATDVGAMDWDALRAAVAGCRACGLCRSRTQTVFGVGYTGARWLLVGEAPGAEEDRRGEPFVGAAGKLLDSMLAALGLQRERDVYIANVLKCRPPQNRNPLPDEVARCEPYLRRQVTLLDPALIIVMGRFAAQSLLQTEASIASLRGRVHRYRNGERSIPVVVTYHPAYLLRNLPDKSRAWADLCLARRTVPAR
ncbi:MAG: uracil-DNA glycosylase family protein [Burkholderiaceae bacterium]